MKSNCPLIVIQEKEQIIVPWAAFQQIDQIWVWGVLILQICSEWNTNAYKPEAL